VVAIAAFIVLTIPCVAAAAEPGAWTSSLARLERRIVDDRNAGRIDAAEYEHLQDRLDEFRTLKEEAVADGVVSAAETADLRQALRALAAELARARKRAPEIAPVTASARRASQGGGSAL